MSKEMTPKDALEYVLSFLSDIKKEWLFKEIEIINQALDRLEVLENKNASLKIKVRAWEIQGKKYKKVIKILKDKKVDLVILLSSNDFKEYNANITIRINGVTYLKGNNYTLTQQEYELIKEFLENV